MTGRTYEFSNNTVNEWRGSKKRNRARGQGHLLVSTTSAWEANRPVAPGTRKEAKAQKDKQCPNSQTVGAVTQVVGLCP